MKVNKTKEIKLKNSNSSTVEDEVEGVMNAIKGDQIKNGNIPDSPPIVVINYAGRKLRINKSLIFKGKQYRLNKGTVWESIDIFFRKWMTFSEKDFESKGVKDE